MIEHPPGPPGHHGSADIWQLINDIIHAVLRLFTELWLTAKDGVHHSWTFVRDASGSMLHSIGAAFTSSCDAIVSAMSAVGGVIMLFLFWFAIVCAIFLACFFIYKFFKAAFRCIWADDYQPPRRGERQPLLHRSTKDRGLPRWTALPPTSRRPRPPMPAEQRQSSRQGYQIRRWRDDQRYLGWAAAQQPFVIIESEQRRETIVFAANHGAYMARENRHSGSASPTPPPSYRSVSPERLPDYSQIGAGNPPPY